jgi:predicted NAD/FAD-dependent oxidoreductase
MLLPRVDLGRLFPEAAAAFVKARGGVLALGQRIDTLAAHGHQWHVQPAGAAPALFDAVVLAVPPPQAASLLAPFEEATALAATLAAFTYEPITTCYLGYAPTLRLPLPLLALCDDPARQHFGQFVFDRGQLDPAQAGVLAVVVSAAGGAAALDQSMLAARLAQQLAQAFPALAAQLGTPLWQRVITDKRATFACTPDLARPPNLTALPGLVLAGDYTAGEYPATLESAVRSGLAAAAAICTGSASSSKKARLSHGAGTGKAPALS